MDTVRWIITAAPEIFLLLAIAIGTILGRVKIRGFSIGTTACILIVAVLIGQLGTFTFPPILRAYPVQPVRLHDRLPVGTGVLCLPERPDAGAGCAGASARRHRPGARAHLCSSVQARSRHRRRSRRRRTDPVLRDRHRIGRTGTARPASDVLEQQEANIAAGYAVTYVLGYILTLLFVPFVAPRLMRIDLKAEAAKLEAELAGGAPAEDR